MAEELDIKAEKKKIAEAKKKLKSDQKAQQKEVKQRAREIAEQEADLDDSAPGGGFSMLVVTLFIIAIWVAILVIIIKLDIGHIGSNVLAPIIGDVPILKEILPKDATTETDDLEA